MRVSEFSIFGFEYLHTDILVDPFDSSSLANATFTGRLSYPTVTLVGVYNTISGTVKFKKQIDLPFGGLNLAFIVEVNLAVSQIVNRFFQGILLNPLRAEVRGNFNGFECLLDLRGEVDVPSEDIGIRAGVVLEFCDNCSRICSAQAASLSVTLEQPWNISLNGSYMLSDNVTTVSVGGAVDIQNINIEVLTTLHGNISLLSVQDLALTAHLPEPVGTDVDGRYSENTGVATFSGSLHTQQIQLSFQLTADIANKMLSDLSFSGNLTSPFFVSLLSFYEFSSNVSNLNVLGELDIDGGFLLLSLTIQLDLTSRTVLHYDFMGMISEPLAVVVRAHYGSMLPADELELCGSIDLQNHTHAIGVFARLNVSTSPVSVSSIMVSGVFPLPLDFISLSGLYVRQCSCAFISGTIMREDFTLTASTNLTFFEGQDPSIDQLNIEVHFHRPVNLFLRGQYMYSETNNSRIIVYGTFNLSQITLSTELLLVMSGMSPLTISHFRFDGTFPFPLNLEVSGDYNSTSSEISLAGGVQYSFAELNASTKYVVMDDVHNVTSGLRDLQLIGTLTAPFFLNIQGLYTFDTESFNLTGSLLVNQYLTLEVAVSIDTSSNPISVDTIAFTGTLMTPIQFEGEFQGNLDFHSNTATMNSNLRVDSALFSAKALLSRQGNSSFELENIMVSGDLPSPLSMSVTGTYIPSNATDLYLAGNLTLGPFILEGTAHAQMDPELALKQVSFRGNLTSPFFVTLLGSYKLSSNMSNLNVLGELDIDGGFLLLSLTIQLDLTSRTVLHYDFMGMISEPLAVVVRAHYGSMLPADELELCGSIDLQNHTHAIGVFARLNVSTSPVSVSSIMVSGVFPPPLDFISLSGLYVRQCSCAFISGTIMREDFTLTASTKLTFFEGQDLSINQVNIDVHFHRPVNLFLRGQYTYAGPNNSHIIVYGTFNLSQITLSTELLLVISGMSSLTTSHFHFDGTFPFPLNLEVSGDYNSTSSEISLAGRVQYSFAELNASTKYVVMDDVHNVSSGLRDLQFTGTLLTPFTLNVHGLYIFGTNSFSLTGSLLVNQYLTLEVAVSIDTSSSPISVDMIAFTGTLMTPIQFEGEFQGNFDFHSNTATLNSNLRVGSGLFSAKALLSRQGNSSFELENIVVSGDLPSPLSISVTGTYIPSSATDLYLAGNLTLGPLIFEGIAHLQQDSFLALKEVMFRGTINDPFTLVIYGNYSTGNTLTLSGSLDLAVFYLVVSTQINLTTTPRTIETVDFLGQLKDPLNGIVTATYTQYSGELILRGIIHVTSLQFSVAVYLNTTPDVVVHLVQFIYFYNPLSLQLVGVYSRDEQRIDFVGIISISSPRLNITAAAVLDLNQETNTLSELTLRADIEQPPLFLTGTYNISNQQVLLTGVLNLARLQFTACALLHLGGQASLDTVTFSISYTIPFNENLHFQLVGTYNSANNTLILKGRIAQRSKKRRSIDHPSVKRLAKRVAGQPSQEGSLFALLILSTETSSVQVVSLNIPEINIGSLLNTYLRIPWPSSFFPLNFRNIAIYRAYTSLTYGGILYREGFHARGEVKIFILPSIIIDATMMTEPERVFQVSFNLQDPVDWGIFAICGRDDSTCSMMGPGLTILVDSGDSKQFTFSGGFRLFQFYIGSIDITVKKERMEANVALSDAVRRLFLYSLPSVIRVSWGDTFFHSPLSIPDLMLPNLSLNNIASPSICALIGGVISKFVINAPFHLQTQLVVKQAENGTLLFRAILSGYVDLEIAGQSAFRVSIAPIAFGVDIPTGQPLTWEIFTDMIRQSIEDSAGNIVDGFIHSSGAIATLESANLIQRGVGETATAICNSIIDSAAGATISSGVATSTAATISSGVATSTAAVTAGAIGSAVGHLIVCGILEILGSSCGGGDSDGGDSDGGDSDGGDSDGGQNNMGTLHDILQQLSCSTNNGSCQQICTQDGLFVRCSCYNGYFLHSNGHSCISKLSCVSHYAQPNSTASQSTLFSTLEYIICSETIYRCLWALVIYILCIWKVWWLGKLVSKHVNFVHCPNSYYINCFCRV